MSADREKDIKKLINDLVTECTRCKCEIRVGDLLNNAPAPCLFEVPTFAKGARPLGVVVTPLPQFFVAHFAP